MKKIYKPLIAVFLIAIIITGAVLIHHFLNRTIYNETAVYGNSAGNFYNGGLFCEANGYVYFSNPLDGYKLYQMQPDGSNVKKLSDDSACFINADSHYIYYARNGNTKTTDFSFMHFNTNSLCRTSLKGKNTLILDSAPTLYVTLIQNSLYYIHYDTATASTLYKVGIDGKDRKKITSEPLLLSPGQEGTLCYAGVSYDHNISLWNPGTDSGTPIYEGVCYLPIDTAEYLYFLDASNDYCLMRCEKSTGVLTQLTDCRIDCYNLTEEYVYYQKNETDHMALCRMRLDGTVSEEIVMEGTYSNIHTTSEYVYFSSFRNPDLFYSTPANGSIQVNNLDISYQE